MKIEKQRFEESGGSHFHYVGTQYTFREGPRRYTVRRHDRTPVEASFVCYEEIAHGTWQQVSLDEVPEYDPLLQQVVDYLIEEEEVLAVNFLLELYEPVDIVERLTHEPALA